MSAYNFNISGNIIGNVNSYPHLGHILTSSFTDTEDISSSRNSLAGPASIFCMYVCMYIIHSYTKYNRNSP